jgi:glycosyltransferase involved in cell wall biosynthesis
MSQQMKLVALVDTLWMGHHPTWFREYVRVLLGQGHAVWALCPRPDEVSAWAQREGLAGQRLSVFPIQELAPSPIHDPLLRPDGPASTIRLFGESVGRLQRYEAMLRRLPPVSSSDLVIADEVFASTADGLGQWLLTRAVLCRAQAQTGRRPDLVFFAKLDAWMQGALSPWLLDRVNLFRYPWSGLYFHPNHFYEKPMWPWVRRGPLAPTAILRSRWCKAVAVLDETVAARLQAELGKPVVAFPDLADDSAPDAALPLAREIRSRAAGRTVVAVLGGLDRRKNIFGLLDAAERLPEEKWFFVFVGYNPFQPEAIGELEARAGRRSNCLVHPHRLEDESAFNAVIECCDIVFAAYRRFPFSSNMATKAAAFGKRVLVSKGAVLEKRVVQHRLGLAIPEDDAVACADALCRLAAGEPADPDFAGYLALHSLSRLEAAFRQVLQAYDL